MVSQPGRRRGLPRTSGVRVRALGIAIKEARAEVNLRLIDVERRSGISKSVLQRLEDGSALPEKLDVSRILSAIGVQDPLFAQLIALAESARLPNWLATGSPDLPWQLQTLMDYEQVANGITNVALGLVPGLLQTEDYARRVFELTGVLPDELNGRLSARIQRQAVLERPDLTFEAIIDELALERPIGSRGVVARQLHHLVYMASRSNISVRIVPRTQSTLAARNASYILMQFEQLPDVVHMEVSGGGIFLDQPRALDKMRETTDMIRRSSLSPADSVELITDTAMRLESHTQ